MSKKIKLVLEIVDQQMPLGFMLKYADFYRQE